MTDYRIDRQYQLPFAVRRVYAAWISSDAVIPPATRLDIDASEGGHYRLWVESPGIVSVMNGRFETVETNRRLRYSWEWNDDGQTSMVEVRFAEDQGGSQIDLSHTGLADAASVERHRDGWDSYIDGLTRYLGK